MLRLLGHRVLPGRGAPSFWGGWRPGARDDERGAAGGSHSHRFYASAAAAEQAAANGLAEAIQRSRDAVDTLDKRQQHVERRIQFQEVAARESVAAGDKRRALLCLKRKKLYEDDLQQLLTSRMALETQIVSLEAAHTQQLAVQAMAGAAKAHRSFSQKLSLGRIDQLLDDIQEQQDVQQEVTQVLTQNVPLLDDGELQKELQQLEAEEMEERVYRLACSIPSAPAGDAAECAAAAASSSFSFSDIYTPLQLQESLPPQQQQQHEPEQQPPLLGYHSPVGRCAAAAARNTWRNETASSAEPAAVAAAAARTTGLNEVASRAAVSPGGEARIGGEKERRLAAPFVCGGDDLLLQRSSSHAPSLPAITATTTGSARSYRSSSSRASNSRHFSDKNIGKNSCSSRSVISALSEPLLPSSPAPGAAAAAAAARFPPFMQAFCSPFGPEDARAGVAAATDATTAAAVATGGYSAYCNASSDRWHAHEGGAAAARRQPALAATNKVKERRALLCRLYNAGGKGRKAAAATIDTPSTTTATGRSAGYGGVTSAAGSSSSCRQYSLDGDLLLLPRRQHLLPRRQQQTGELDEDEELCKLLKEFSQCD